ncbi:DUF6438 domain-containing protein [Altererythrobacter sp. CAU 1778]
MINVPPIRFAALALASVSLSGCMATAPEPQSSASGESITFSVSPCFGACPQFAVDVSKDGNGTYTGERFVAVTGERDFTATAVQTQAFFDRLEKFRPERSVRYDYENCEGPVATDSPSVKVTWNDADGGATTLDWYMGCRQPGLTEVSNALYRAWEELPLAELVGSDENRFNYRND